MEDLVTLNVSNNNFIGYLSNTKLFRQLSASDLAGNPGLYTRGGDVCFMRVGTDREPTTAVEEETRRLHRLKLAMVVLVLGMVGAVRPRQVGGRKGGGGDNDPGEMGGGEMAWSWQFTPFQKLNFSVEQVVSRMVDANVIRKGCSSVVYQVDMEKNAEGEEAGCVESLTGGRRENYATRKESNWIY